MRLSAVLILTSVVFVPLRVDASTCAGYTHQAEVAIEKAQQELQLIKSRGEGYRELAVSLLTKIRAVEDRLISCGMTAGGDEWDLVSAALTKLAVSNYPLRGLLLSESFPADDHWVASDRSLTEALHALSMKKASSR